MENFKSQKTMLWYRVLKSALLAVIRGNIMPLRMYLKMMNDVEKEFFKIENPLGHWESYLIV